MVRVYRSHLHTTISDLFYSNPRIFLQERSRTGYKEDNIKDHLRDRPKLFVVYPEPGDLGCPSFHHLAVKVACCDS